VKSSNRFLLALLVQFIGQRLHARQYSVARRLTVSDEGGLDATASDTDTTTATCVESQSFRLDQTQLNMVRAAPIHGLHWLEREDRVFLNFSD
jgi:hypothetical protein